MAALCRLLNIKCSNGDMIQFFDQVAQVGRTFQASFGATITSAHLIEMFACYHVPENYQHLRNSQDDSDFDRFKTTVIEEFNRRQLTAPRKSLLPAANFSAKLDPPLEASAQSSKKSASQCKHRRSADTCYRCHPETKPCFKCVKDGATNAIHRTFSSECSYDAPVKRLPKEANFASFAPVPRIISSRIKTRSNSTKPLFKVSKSLTAHSLNALGKSILPRSQTRTTCFACHRRYTAPRCPTIFYPSANSTLTAWHPSLWAESSTLFRPP